MKQMFSMCLQKMIFPCTWNTPSKQPYTPSQGHDHFGACDRIGASYFDDGWHNTKTCGASSGYITFFNAVKKAGLSSLAHSKFHWLCHFHEHHKKLGFLPSCFCHERKHKQVKKFCANTFSAQGYEFAILKELCAQDLHGLQQKDVFATHARLQHQCKATKKIVAMLEEHVAFTELFTCSVACLKPAGTASKGDVVLLENMKAGQIFFHVQLDQQILSLLEHLEPQGYDPATCSASWKRSQKSIFVDTSSIKCTLVFHELPNGNIVGLVPLAFRPL